MNEEVASKQSLSPSVPTSQRRLRKSSISLAGIKKDGTFDVNTDSPGSDGIVSEEPLPSAPAIISSPGKSPALQKSISFTGSLFSLFTKKRVDLAETETELHKNKSTDSLSTEECNSNTTNSFSSDVSGTNGSENSPLTQAYNNISYNTLPTSQRSNSTEDPLLSATRMSTVTMRTPSQELAKKRMSLSLSSSVNAANTPPMSRRKSLILPQKSPVLSQKSRKTEISRGDNTHTFHNPIALLNNLRNQSLSGENAGPSDRKLKEEEGGGDDEENTGYDDKMLVTTICSSPLEPTDDTTEEVTLLSPSSAAAITHITTPSSVGSIGTPGRPVSGRRKSFMRSKSTSFDTANTATFGDNDDEQRQQQQQTPRESQEILSVHSPPPPPPPPPSAEPDSPSVTILSTPDGRRLSIKALTPNAPPAPLPPPPRPTKVGASDIVASTKTAAATAATVAALSNVAVASVGQNSCHQAPPPSPPPAPRMATRPLPPTPTAATAVAAGRGETDTDAVVVGAKAGNVNSDDSDVSTVIEAVTSVTLLCENSIHNHSGGGVNGASNDQKGVAQNSNNGQQRSSSLSSSPPSLIPPSLIKPATLESTSTTTAAVVATSAKATAAAITVASSSSCPSASAKPVKSPLKSAADSSKRKSSTTGRMSLKPSTAIEAPPVGASSLLSPPPVATSSVRTPVEAQSSSLPSPALSPTGRSSLQSQSQSPSPSLQQPQSQPLRRKSVSFGQNMTSEFHPDDRIGVVMMRDNGNDSSGSGGGSVSNRGRGGGNHSPNGNGGVHRTSRKEQL